MVSAGLRCMLLSFSSLEDPAYDGSAANYSENDDEDDQPANEFGPPLLRSPAGTLFVFPLVALGKPSGVTVLERR